jgi:hypothetical protein
MSELQPNDAPGGFDRRTFVKRTAVGAFAIPAVVSFKLDSLARAGGYQSWPNQGHGNQTFPNQTRPNQTFPNQTFPNQTTPQDFIERLIRFLRLLFR